MNKKYEISIWKDTYSASEGRWYEEKLMVIGSDTMTSQSRAREPKLVSNINGTNTFTFTMYYSYINNETGEYVKNPFTPFLVNERKIKVYWSGARDNESKWYDLLVKNIKEDSQNHTFTYTCEDQYLTELSRTGFNLEFAYELENNIGTPQYLVEQVIDGTDWQFDTQNSEIIYQLTEEPVYEITTSATFEALKEPQLNSITINEHKSILVFYSCAPAASLDALKSSVQFMYTDESWQQDDNDMLVLNGDCCEVEVTWVINEDGHSATASIDGTDIFTIDFNDGLSTKYRAKRYVDSQKTEYSAVVDRYVDVYKDSNNNLFYGYETTEFNDALAVVNLITNASNFKDVSGWEKTNDEDDGLIFRIYPPFGPSIEALEPQEIAKYHAKSYLSFAAGKTYKNSGLQNNRSYIKDGFVEDETYIFRYRCVADHYDICGK